MFLDLELNAGNRSARLFMAYSTDELFVCIETSNSGSGETETTCLDLKMESSVRSNGDVAVGLLAVVSPRRLLDCGAWHSSDWSAAKGTGTHSATEETCHLKLGSKRLLGVLFPACNMGRQ